MTDDPYKTRSIDLDSAQADRIGELLERNGDEVPRSAGERGWLEVWGSLPLELEPVAPLPETWQSIRAQIHTDSERASINDSQYPTGNVVEFAPSEQANAPESGWGAVAMRWAAVLAVALLGTSLWLANEVNSRDSEIASLRQELADRQLSEKQFSENLGNLRQVSVPAVSGSYVDFVAAGSIESCDLVAQGDAEGARGWLYMGGDDPSCFLAVEGLRPLQEGQTYRVWLRADGQPVPVGTVEVVGNRGEAFMPNIPGNVEAVFVTVEAADLSPAAPQGPTVLYGDTVVASL